MLNTKVGNCYGFASTLAAFAKELGYKKIELIDGRTPGTRDHAPDGFTGHCWVRIDNRYYDPEADWAGWMTGCMDITHIRLDIMLKRFIIS